MFIRVIINDDVIHINVSNIESLSLDYQVGLESKGMTWYILIGLTSGQKIHAYKFYTKKQGERALKGLINYTNRVLTNNSKEKDVSFDPKK